MVEQDAENSYVIHSLLNLFPSSLRKEVILDTVFRKTHNLTTDAEISFGISNSNFSRSSLFQSVREAFSSNDKYSYVKDVNGNDWNVSIESDDDLTVCIRKEDAKLYTNLFWSLTNDIDARVNKFKKEADIRSLSSNEIESWISILEKEALTDDEVNDLKDDLETTPSYIKETLQAELGTGTNKIATFVPDNIKYYERLVGKYVDSSNIYEYSKNEFKVYLENDARTEIGEFELILSAHSSISETLSAYILDEEQVEKLFTKALEVGDPITLVCCIEVGLTLSFQTIEEKLKQVFDRVCLPENFERIKLFTALTMFVDGELSRLQVFRGKPPFYRRLCSIVQASLIVKLAIEQGVEFKGIEKWAVEQRGKFFFCQTIIDLRTEPRWLPSYLTPEQFRDEFYGRISNACHKNSESIFSKYALQVFNDSSLIKLNAFLPGPLEGNTESPIAPEDVVKRIEQGLSDNVSFESFTALINSVQYWKIDEKYTTLAIKLLVEAQHQLKNTESKYAILHTLNGLARVSSIVKSKELAASVMILTRIYREYLNVNSKTETIMEIGLVASAACSDLDEWAEFIGQWFTELVYLKIDSNVIPLMRDILEQLCILEPYLYYTCGRPLEVLKILDDE